MSKNISIIYNVASGHWVARDNGEIIAEGDGLPSATAIERKLKAQGTKPVRFNWKR